MIRPSQRRRAPERPQQELNVHRRLARVRDRNRRLMLASVLALLAALLAWVFGLELTLRAGLVAAAAISAWLVPLRGSTEWALSWIGERAGLAYQTALEYDGGNDRYGLRQALEERASTSLTRLEAPTHSAWWLPLAALALGALLLPALPLGSGTGFGPGSLPPGSNFPAPGGADNGEPEEAPDPNLPDEEQTRVARAPNEPQASGERGAEGDADAEGQAGEREALERYLRNIRERPAELEEDQEENAEGPAGDPAGGAPREGAGEQQEQGREGPAQSRPGEGEGERSEERAGDEGQEQGESQEGGGEQQQQQQNPFAEAGEEEGESEGAEPGEGGEAGGEPNTEEQLQEHGEEAPGPGESSEGGDQQGQGQGAGGQASAEQPADRAGELGGETLQLQGDLREGPLEGGGTIQLPGGDEVPLPPGRTAESYTREVERSVTEGRIPLEYQEIIRNYFR